MTRREHAVILMGLRLLQTAIDSRYPSIQWVRNHRILTAGGELEPLSFEQIDALCMRLNDDSDDEFKVED